MPVGTEGDIDNAGPSPRQSDRIKTQAGQAAGMIALDKDPGMPGQIQQLCCIGSSMLVQQG